MNLSIDLDRRWSPALSQWPKPVMAQRDPTSTAADQSVDVNQLESQAEAWSQAATVGPAQHLNRQVHQVQQQLEQTVLVLNQLESVLRRLPHSASKCRTNYFVCHTLPWPHTQH